MAAGTIALRKRVQLQGCYSCCVAAPAGSSSSSFRRAAPGAARKSCPRVFLSSFRRHPAPTLDGHAAFHRLEIAVALSAPQIAKLDLLPLRKPRAAVREMDRMQRLLGPR